MIGAQFTLDATSDVREIHDYVERYNVSAAERLVNLFEQTCDTLAQNPNMGRDRTELAPNLRSFPAGTYVIFYRPVADGVEIIRVVHQARDITTMF